MVVWSRVGKREATHTRGRTKEQQARTRACHACGVLRVQLTVQLVSAWDAHYKQLLPKDTAAGTCSNVAMEVDLCGLLCTSYTPVTGRLDRFAAKFREGVTKFRKRELPVP